MSIAFTVLSPRSCLTILARAMLLVRGAALRPYSSLLPELINSAGIVYIHTDLIVSAPSEYLVLGRDIIWFA